MNKFVVYKGTFCVLNFFMSYISQPGTVPIAQPVVAVPVMEKPFDEENNVYENGTGPWASDDAIERSSNIFSQVLVFCIVISNFLLIRFVRSVVGRHDCSCSL